MTTITERIAAGAAFLDEHDPEWWREGVDRAIKLDRLEMWRGDRCVLGQRCPVETMDSRYFAYARLLSGTSDPTALLKWAVRLGFYSTHTNHSPPVNGWELLTAEWKRFITERRAS